MAGRGVKQRARTPLAPPGPGKGRSEPPAARPPAPGVRAGSAVCFPIHIPIHIPIHNPAGPGPRSPRHPPRLRPRAGPFQAGGAGSLGGPGRPPPRLRSGAVSRLGSALLFPEGAFPHFEPRRRAQGPSSRIGAPEKVKIKRKYRYLSFGLFSVRFPLLSPRCCYVRLRSSACAFLKYPDTDLYIPVHLFIPIK